MPDVIFPFAFGKSIKTFLDDMPTPTGRSIAAGASAEDSFDALAYALYIRELTTGNGDDTVRAEARATGGHRAEARGLSIGDATGTGFFGPGIVDLGAGNDALSVTATASTPAAGANGEILKVSASGVTVDLGSALLAGTGDDKMELTATATAAGKGGNPDLVVSASGLESLGVTRLGDGDDIVFGRGTANADELETWPPWPSASPRSPARSAMPAIPD